MRRKVVSGGGSSSALQGTLLGGGPGSGDDAHRKPGFLGVVVGGKQNPPHHFRIDSPTVGEPAEVRAEELLARRSHLPGRQRQPTGPHVRLGGPHTDQRPVDRGAAAECAGVPPERELIHRGAYLIAAGR